jgi:hypothetical protein
MRFQPRQLIEVSVERGGPVALTVASRRGTDVLRLWLESIPVCSDTVLL